MLAKDDDDGIPAGCPSSLFLAVPASKSAWEKMLKFWFSLKIFGRTEKDVSNASRGLASF